MDDLALSDPLSLFDPNIDLSGANTQTFYDGSGNAVDYPAVAASTTYSAPTVATVTTTGIDPNAVPLVSSIGNSVSSIVKSIFGGPQAGAYNAAGQFVPITGSTKPIGSSTQLGTIANSAVSGFTSLLPLLLLGGALYFLVTLFSKKR